LENFALPNQTWRPVFYGVETLSSKKERNEVKKGGGKKGRSVIHFSNGGKSVSAEKREKNESLFENKRAGKKGGIAGRGEKSRHQV